MKYKSLLFAGALMAQSVFGVNESYAQNKDDSQVNTFTQRISHFGQTVDSFIKHHDAFLSYLPDHANKHTIAHEDLPTILENLYQADTHYRKILSTLYQVEKQLGGNSLELQVNGQSIDFDWQALHRLDLHAADKNLRTLLEGVVDSDKLQLGHLYVRAERILNDAYEKNESIEVDANPFLPFSGKNEVLYSVGSNNIYGEGFAEFFIGFLGAGMMGIVAYCCIESSARYKKKSKPKKVASKNKKIKAPKVNLWD